MDEKELYKLIESQAKEIAELKSALAKLQPAEQQPSFSTDLLAYFLQKYEKYFNAYQKERFDLIDTNLERLQKDLKEKEKEDIDQNKIAAENATIESEQENCGQQIEELYIELEKLAYDADKKSNKLTKKQFQLEQELIEPWKELTSCLEQARLRGEYAELLAVIEKLKTAESPETKLYSSLEKISVERVELLEGLSNQQAALGAKIQDLELKKKALESKKKLSLMPELITKIASIKAAIEDAVQYRANLDNLFERRRLEHLQEIKELYLEAKVMGKDNQEIGLFLDAKIEEFVQRLHQTDTTENLERLTTERGEKLKCLVVEQTNLQQNISKLEIEYSTLQEKYVDVRRHIHEIDEYLVQLNEAIEQNASYQQYLVLFHSYQKQRKQVLDAQKLGKANLDKLFEKRKIVVHDPFARDSLKEIDYQIGIVREELQHQQIRGEQIDNELAALINRNIKLHTIILEKEKYEGKLPEFREQMDEFKALIEEKHERLLESNRQLNSIRIEINDLKDLLNENYH